jgi:hypothetical protein
LHAQHCTGVFRKQYRPLLLISFVDTLPQNGTVCYTDHSGMNNIFIQQFSDEDGSTSKRGLELGLGLGLGLILLVSSIIVFGYWRIRKGNTLGDDMSGGLKMRSESTKS